MKANDIIHNIVKDKLKRDEVVASMTVRLVRGVEIARLAATAGFDINHVEAGGRSQPCDLDAAHKPDGHRCHDLVALELVLDDVVNDIVRLHHSSPQNGPFGLANSIA